MLQYRNDIILSFDPVFTGLVLCKKGLRIHGKSGICLMKDRLISNIFVDIFKEFIRSVGKVSILQLDSIFGK